VTDDIHTLADRHLSGDYTVEKREFTDGDSRELARHSIGWELGTRFAEVLWRNGDFWIEYYEGDTLRDRRVFSWDLRSRVV
jgi:hypothetical protein